jgi:hypothetical protein
MAQKSLSAFIGEESPTAAESGWLHGGRCGSIRKSGRTFKNLVWIKAWGYRTFFDDFAIENCVGFLLMLDGSESRINGWRS